MHMTNFGVWTMRLAGPAALALALAAAAQLPAKGQGAPAAAPPPAYRPGVGDLMVGSVQPRHIKLAAGGQAKNWAYAAYTLHELGESFDRLARTFPNIRQMPTADLIASTTKAPMAALDAAITAGDAERFKTAYAQLTDGCNACHIQTGRNAVVIRVPDAVSMYPDQDFAPKR
jgi:hypothetical protein